ncbi:hypothetical protein A3G14_02885 [Candidatus Curtissbacteria bacterium RIFCSPLOWO2_12_FULL_38_9]|uniref:PIN domain-containing protein n=2 Tax=Candidatus Curtissiibacteriota TaxID=1752717 RepID=A0A1F5GB68_9BACT|nr:MAG: hypothetical protein A2775_01335 [Candidatus Curtissbacteria bacterium RIFCSPHIGHO2_01_FULL_39_57]OGD89090.1 MAG: hypothetical protein A3D04_05035 [Candidatus Curtissbacteria bacterium RIFCSPHIGHO2_02_FULL_40_16b]OGE13391.1 MAG: hypothetical protein A3G14_02885 [Candidatus Curtissbacteria bacterium RIFCSPLOWO2_12_FULL_38_9]
MNVALDASVVIKWFFEEEGTDAALQLLEEHKLEKIQINVPDLLFFEFGNTVVKKFREDIDTRKEFNRNLTDLLAIGLNFAETTPDLLKLAYSVANRYEITFHDATYIALAKNLKCNFITADKKLVEATKKLKFVKLL